MGARGLGHIAYLTRIAPPRIGVVLNVGTAHVGEFGVAARRSPRAKGELVEALPRGRRSPCSTPTTRWCGAWPRARRRRVRPRRRGRRRRRPRERRRRSTTRPAGVPSLTAPGSADVTLALAARHHVGNALAAAAVALELGLPLDAGLRPRWRRPAPQPLADGGHRARRRRHRRQRRLQRQPRSVRAALSALAAMAGGGPHLGGARRDARARRRVGGRARTRSGEVAARRVDGSSSWVTGAAPLAAVRTRRRGPGSRRHGHPARCREAPTHVREAAAVDGRSCCCAPSSRPGDVVLVKSQPRRAGCGWLGDPIWPGREWGGARVKASSRGRRLARHRAVRHPAAHPVPRPRGYGQFIRDDGPTSHHTKRGTPTMGGAVIIGASLAATPSRTSSPAQPPTVERPARPVPHVRARVRRLPRRLHQDQQAAQPRACGREKLVGPVARGRPFAVLALQFPNERVPHAGLDARSRSSATPPSTWPSRARSSGSSCSSSGPTS